MEPPQLLEELLTEDNFEVRFNVALFTSSLGLLHEIISNIELYEDPFIIPCEELLRYPGRFLRTVFLHRLSDQSFRRMSSLIVSQAQRALEETTLPSETTSRHRLIHLTFHMRAEELTTTNQEDDLVNDMNAVIEQSMQQSFMVPASEEAIASLRKFRVQEDQLNAERCAVCLEDFAVDDDDLLQMPCDHVFHNDCIVRWLTTSHMCPMCRFQMPCE